MMASIIELEQGWSTIMTGFNKLKRILEGEPEPACTASELMNLYATVYRICTKQQEPRYKYSKELYDKYLHLIKDYNEQTVLPSIKKKHGEKMLRELVKRWSNNKIMLKRLSNVFAYLDRYYIPWYDLPSLEECGLTCFRDRVYHEIQSEAKDVLLAFIYKELDGEQIDRELLKNVIEVFIENEKDNMERYEEDFESSKPLPTKTPTQPLLRCQPVFPETGPLP